MQFVSSILGSNSEFFYTAANLAAPIALDLIVDKLAKGILKPQVTRLTHYLGPARPDLVYKLGRVAIVLSPFLLPAIPGLILTGDKESVPYSAYFGLVFYKAYRSFDDFACEKAIRFIPYEAKTIFSLWEALASKIHDTPTQEKISQRRDLFDPMKLPSSIRAGFTVFTPWFIDRSGFTKWFNENLEELNRIETLDLSNQGLTSLPPCIGQLSQLQKLDLSQNKLSSIPNSISQLSHLQELILDNNELTVVPESIGQLSQLQKLFLANNQLSALPESFGQLSHLQELILDNNELTVVLESIGQLSQLQKLFLANNQLSALPESFTQLSLLQLLGLKYNRLSALPDNIGQLSNLQRLDLANNQLSSLPQSFGQLSNLQRINLANNQLSTLPDNIGQLSNLQQFGLSNNQLLTLPQSLGQLFNLQKLYLNNNQLSSLPATLANLSAECIIQAEHNRFTPQSLITFQNHIDQVRCSNPRLGPKFNAASLDQTLILWLQAFQRAFPSLMSRVDPFPPAGSPPEAYRSFCQPLLEHPHSERLGIFLERLKETQAFKNGGNSKRMVISRLGQMIHRASKQELFRNHLFTILDDALGTCGDRITLAFNKIEVKWHLSQAGELSETQLAQLLIGAKRVDLLEAIARERTHELRMSDEVEVILFYQIRLKEALGLPITTSSMLYEITGAVPDEILAEDQKIVLSQTTSRENIIQTLLGFEEWEERIKALYKADFEKITFILEEEVDEVRGQNLREQEKICESLGHQHQSLTKDLLWEITQDWVAQHYAELKI